MAGAGGHDPDDHGLLADLPQHDVPGMVPAQGDLRETACSLVASAPWATLVVQAQATVVPAMECESRPSVGLSNPGLSRDDMVAAYNQSTFTPWPLPPDACSPDPTQPYPLDDLLSRIDDVTSERR